jgi:hypothetical protein
MGRNKIGEARLVKGYGQKKGGSDWPPDRERLVGSLIAVGMWELPGRNLE